VLTGLGESTGPVLVRVIWPDGRQEEWTDVAVDRYTTLKQGSVICGFMVMPSACVSREAPPPAASRQPLPAVALPDLSRVSEPERQFRDRFASFSQALENRRTPREELAGACGQLGQLLLAAKFGDQAELCFLHAQALSADDMRWPYYLGHVYLMTGDRTKAAAAFERALALRPTDAAALVWLAETELDRGRADAAEALFLKAASFQPGSAAPMFGAGRAALARQAYGDAVRHLERALSIDPQASAVHYPLAMAYRAMGDDGKAESHVRQRGESWPSLADPLMQQQGELLESVSVYEGRGMQALGAGDWTGAAGAFRAGLELAPDDPALRHRLAMALYSAGDVAGAVKSRRHEDHGEHCSVRPPREAGHRRTPQRDPLRAFFVAPRRRVRPDLRFPPFTLQRVNAPHGRRGRVESSKRA
jgi:tetratricopeptide (TPR) repeat protein